MEYTGSGDIVCIPFNTDIAANPDFATLADGTYRADTTGGDGSHAKHTFDAGKSDSYVEKYDYDIRHRILVNEGTITVTSTDGITTIKGDLTLNDNSAYTFQYTGRIPVANRSGEGNTSSLTADIKTNNLTQGVAYIMARYATSPAKSNHIRYGRRLRPHCQRRLQRRPPGQRLSRILSIKFVVHISTKICIFAHTKKH